MAALSVVMPTLNCVGMMREHIASMQPWLDLASEVIVVDSYSDDGTPALIRDELKHPNLQILSHPKGLYQSWNFAIANTTGDWIYISTAGDSITRAQLEHLLHAGDSLGADVVCSPPSFVAEDGAATAAHGWPIERILNDFQISEPTVISPLTAFYYAIDCVPCAILGSSASNIYRGDPLRARPFPTDYAMVGDTAWSLKYALDTKYCFTPRINSTFRVHAKEYSPPDVNAMSTLNKSLLALARQTYDNHPGQTGHRQEFERFIQHSCDLEDAQIRYRATRKGGLLPWFLQMEAWRARTLRNKLRAIRQRLALHPLILKEPIHVLGQSPR
jgi:glycosyltransferase involved in cell wall biosynthesis